MIRSHKIKLYPNNIQKTYFLKACGCARLSYNWGLVEWKKQYENGENPSEYSIKKKFNSIKKEQFPFVYEVTKTACEGGFSDLGKAYTNFFRNLKRDNILGYPKFKKKGIRDSFYISNDKFSVKGRYIKIPKLNKIRMAENLRFDGKILSAIISRTANKWFVSISVEISDRIKNQERSSVGIDLGIEKLVTLSNGTIFRNPKITKKFEKRLRSLNKSLSRKSKNSLNRKKIKTAISILHYRIKCARSDNIHKMTTEISEKFSDIVMEDLNVSGMMKNKRLSKALADAAFYEIKRQLSYKAKNLYFVDRWFPSTKLCMDCGYMHDMPLDKRVFKCDCNGIEIDRDVHAAQNILRQGLPDVKPVELEALTY